MAHFGCVASDSLRWQLSLNRMLKTWYIIPYLRSISHSLLLEESVPHYLDLHLAPACRPSSWCDLRSILSNWGTYVVLLFQSSAQLFQRGHKHGEVRSLSTFQCAHCCFPSPHRRELGFCSCCCLFVCLFVSRLILSCCMLGVSTDKD